MRSTTMYEVGKDELEAIEAVLSSKKYFRYQGKDVETVTSLCEKEWQTYQKAPFCLLTTSGTNALVVGMAAFGIGPGDEVIIPSYTFVATASAVMQVGAIPVIANIDDSMTIDPKEVISKISERTKAVVAVHMDGLICDLEELAKICCDHKLLLVEDAAQACGGTYKGVPVGSYGAFGGLSFNVDKIISCGEGGLLVIGHENFEKQYKKAFVTHDTASQYGLTKKEDLDEVSGFFGLSTRLNEINSSILRAQLKRLPDILVKLRGRKQLLINEFKKHQIPMRLGHDNDGDIGTNIHVKCSDPLHTLELTKKLIQNGYRAMAPQLRPAHACWQWMSSMTKDQYYVDGLNPYSLTDKSYSYEKAHFIRTVQILGETLRIEINYDGDDDQYREWMQHLVTLIQE